MTERPMAERALLALCVCLGLAACGEAPTLEGTHIHLDQALVAETTTLNIWVMEGQRTDGIQLSCYSLLGYLDVRVTPNDDQVVVLGQTQVDVGGGAAQLNDLPAGSGRVVYVQAFDQNNQLLGDGCTADVEIPSGGTVAVQVDVYPLQ